LPQYTLSMAFGPTGLGTVFWVVAKSGVPHLYRIVSPPPILAAAFRTAHTSPLGAMILPGKG